MLTLYFGLTRAGIQLDRRILLAGELQLLDEVSRQADRDLLRYTQKDGKVSVPITVSGLLGRVAVRVGISDLAKRALANRASEERKEGILKGLGKIIREPSR